ncbi:hypothetical protein [Fictibacillus terranigra]|uniref:Uncharacterized protein n=1 Tax=Fictibacillus terranigra TaxID=3058424 RepID=A0ABT8EC18_9BACL|nr:hypothetical protein [Fictibacillus sp. CENA-BCM004]MDN4075461.1 hypothetical protein [Fictibacillus sp. CENA-BCM004]
MNFSTVELLFHLKFARKERVGYYPSKLTDSYIQTLAARMEESAKKDNRSAAKTDSLILPSMASRNSVSIIQY